MLTAVMSLLILQAVLAFDTGGMLLYSFIRHNKDKLSVAAKLPKYKIADILTDKQQNIQKSRQTSKKSLKYPAYERTVKAEPFIQNMQI